MTRREARWVALGALTAPGRSDRRRLTPVGRARVLSRGLLAVGRFARHSTAALLASSAKPSSPVRVRHQAREPFTTRRQSGYREWQPAPPTGRSLGPREVASAVEIHSGELTTWPPGIRGHGSRSTNIRVTQSTGGCSPGAGGARNSDPPRVTRAAMSSELPCPTAEETRLPAGDLLPHAPRLVARSRLVATAARGMGLVAAKASGARPRPPPRRREHGWPVGEGHDPGGSQALRGILPGQGEPD